MRYLCLMNKLYITYIKNVEGTDINCGVAVENVVNYAYDGKTLYLFLNEQIDALRIMTVPVKRKPTKDNPQPWGFEEQARMIKESYTIEITEADKIDKFLNYINQNSI